MVYARLVPQHRPGHQHRRHSLATPATRRHARNQPGVAEQRWLGPRRLSRLARQRHTRPRAALQDVPILPPLQAEARAAPHPTRHLADSNGQGGDGLRRLGPGLARRHPLERSGHHHAGRRQHILLLQPLPPQMVHEHPPLRPHRRVHQAARPLLQRIGRFPARRAVGHGYRRGLLATHRPP